MATSLNGLGKQEHATATPLCEADDIARAEAAMPDFLAFSPGNVGQTLTAAYGCSPFPLIHTLVTNSELPGDRVVGFGPIPGGPPDVDYWILLAADRTERLAIPASDIIASVDVADLSDISFSLVAEASHSVSLPFDAFAPGEIAALARGLEDQRVHISMLSGIKATDRRSISFSSVPDGATVWLDGKRIGSTELMGSLREAQFGKIEMRMDGYQPCAAQITPSDNGPYAAECHLVAMSTQ